MISLMRTCLRRGLALLAGLGIAACSLLVQRDGVQCSVDGDCAKRGPAFAGTKCDTANKVCVASCSVNADCKPQPAVCRASQCVPLLTAECARTIPALGANQSVDDSAVVLGALFSLGGTNASSGTARMNSVDLAVSNVARDVVGLPGGTGGKPRPLLVVACTDTDANNMDVSQAAAGHLVKDLHVPAVLGPGASGLVLNVAKNVTMPGGTFLITPSATTTQLTGLDPLVWRTSPSDEIQSRALIASIGEIEAKYRVDNMIMMATPLRLAIAYKNDSYGTNLSQLVAGGAKLNGLAVTDAMNAANYMGVQYDPNADLAGVVTSLASFQPNIVAVFGTTEGITKILQPLEAAWPVADGGGGPPRPAYLLSDGGQKQELVTAVMGNDPLRLRVRLTVPGADESTNQLFKLFRLAYQGNKTYCPSGSCPDTFGMAGAFDSVYLVTLAVASIPKPADAAAPWVTGAGIAAGMKLMVGGTKFGFGMDKLQDAMNTVLAGKALDVDGASGPLDFDLAAHEAPSDIQVLCVSGGTFAPTGRYYSASAKAMSGVFSCP